MQTTGTFRKQKKGTHWRKKALGRSAKLIEAKAKFCSLYLKLTFSHNLTDPPDNIVPVVAILCTYVGVLIITFKLLFFCYWLTLFLATSSLTTQYTTADIRCNKQQTEMNDLAADWYFVTYIQSNFLC